MFKTEKVGKTNTNINFLKNLKVLKGDLYMVLVLFFCSIIVMITLVIVFILISTIRIEIKNVKISNTVKMNSKYIIKISAHLLNKFKWLAFEIDKTRIKKFTKKMHLEKIDMQKLEKNINLYDIKQIINIKPKLAYLDLKMSLGVEDVILTSYIIPIVSTAISIIMPYITKDSKFKNINYKILPVYNEQNVYDIKLDVTVEIKVINVLNAMYKIYKNGTYYQYKKLNET